MGSFGRWYANIDFIVCALTGSRRKTIIYVSPYYEIKKITKMQTGIHSTFKEGTLVIVINAHLTWFSEVGRVLGYTQYLVVLMHFHGNMGQVSVSLSEAAPFNVGGVVPAVIMGTPPEWAPCVCYRRWVRWGGVLNNPARIHVPMTVDPRDAGRSRSCTSTRYPQSSVMV
jgi:hypothetical protein